MTREQAINYLRSSGFSEEQIQEIVKALEQEPCDCISRQQAVDKMQELEDEDIEMYGCSIPEGFDGKRAIEALNTLPSIQPKTESEI
jgi:DNA-binding transcriptional MerR regulator